MELQNDKLGFIRRSELNENSTRYDYFRAAPSDEDLKIMWGVWSIITLAVAVVCGIMTVSILISSKARKEPFNLFVLFLTIPDLVYGVSCFVSCLMNYQAGHFYSVAMCEWQGFYTVFAITANTWLNTIIARNLHILVKKTHQREQFQSITPKSAMVQSLGVYAFAVFVTSWAFYGFLPHKFMLSKGLGCIPIEYNRASTFFLWLAFIPTAVGIPLIYTLWICFDVYWKDMLPRSGRTRVLVFYFAKLSGVFLFIWLPAVLTLFVLPESSSWTAWSGGTISHMQGLVSACIAMTNPDICAAVIRFLGCKFVCQKDDEEEGDDTRGAGTKRFHKSGRILKRMKFGASTTQNMNSLVSRYHLADDEKEEWVDNKADAFSSTLFSKEPIFIMEPQNAVERIGSFIRRNSLYDIAEVHIEEEEEDASSTDGASCYYMKSCESSFQSFPSQSEDEEQPSNRVKPRTV